MAAERPDHGGTERIAGEAPCSVYRCPCGCVHVHIGAVTVRLAALTFHEMAAVMSEASLALASRTAVDRRH